MVRMLKGFFAAPEFEDLESTRAAYLLNFVTWIYLGLAILGTLGVLSLYDGGENVNNKLILVVFSTRVLPFLFANILGQAFMRLGYVRAGSVIFVSLLWMAYTAIMVINGGVHAAAYPFYFLVILLAALLLGIRTAGIFLGLSIASGFVFAVLEDRGRLLAPLRVSAILDFVALSIGFVVATAVIYLFLRILRQATDDIQTANARLQVAGELLEATVTQRTHDLAVAAEVGRTLSQIQDVEQLLNQSVKLIRERYGLYYVQIYLLADDDKANRLLLRAGTGGIGRLMMQRQHRLIVTKTSINGLAVEQKRSVLVGNVAESNIFRRHPHLPDTRSELSVPLLVGNRVIGTLDMHSETVNTFNQDSLPVFETIGSQLAISVNNATLFTEHRKAERALRSSEMLFSSVIDNATAVIYIKHANGSYMLVNKQYEKLFNISNESIRGKTDYDIFAPEIADAVRQNDLDVLARRETLTLEEDIPHADGLHSYISVKFPLLDEQGKAYAVAGISTDITKVKTAEFVLAERVSQLSLLNSIGRKIGQNTPVPELLAWAAAEIPSAMRYTDDCIVSIRWDGQIYGDADAGKKPRHIIEEMRIQSGYVGHITVAYEPAHAFEDADSALLGGVGQRIGAYLQTQLLLAQMQQRNDDLQLVADVMTTVSVIRDPFQLMQNAVNLIKEKFDLYHAHILLLDELDQELVSTVGAGKVGAELVAMQHALHVNNPHSLVAQAARQHNPATLNDVKANINFVSHPLLPKTASEMAVPLRFGDNLLGVLDVQSTKRNAFTGDKEIVYMTLATQVAVALQNARQYERTQTVLDDVNALQQAAAREGWRTLAKRDGYAATTEGVSVLGENGRSEIQNGDYTIMPMRVRGAQIGSIAVRATADSLSDIDQELLSSISTQVAEALERARFFEEIEQARHHTETLYNIGRVLPTIDSSSELLRTIADGAAESVNAHQILLLLCDVNKKQMVDVVAGGVGRDGVGLDVRFDDIWNGLSGWTLREGKTAFSPKGVRDERESTLAHQYRLDHDIGSLIVVPLIYQNKILGTLTAINPIQQPDFTSADVELLTAFGVQATVAIENRNLLDETRKRAGREQTLREIATSVNTAVDAESVLKTAVKEVGRAMGLEIFAYLDEVAVEQNGGAAA